MNPLHSVQLIGAACGLGAPDIRCEEGPGRMRMRLTARGKLHGNLSWRETVCATSGLATRFQFSEMLAFDRHLAHTVRDTVGEGSRFIVIGGDHSCAVGTWQGAAKALAERGKLGLIWIDAHMDAHTPLTSPTGNRHGMPLAALLGSSSAATTFQIDGSHATLTPSKVCLIGVRSFEPAEQQLLNERGVRVFAMTEVRERGLMAVLRDALALVQQDTAGFGVTVDLDAVDPLEAPAVTTPVANGIHADDLIAAIEFVAQQRKLIGVEIAEYNPHNDELTQNVLEAGRTGALIEQLIDAIAHAEINDPDIEREQRYCAHNYAPLPVVLTRGKGIYVWDTAGKRYIDMMAAYSAVSLGHAHPRLLATLTTQANRLSLVSRAYYSDRLGPLAQRLCTLTGFDRMLPMNTGAEAVETALKAARKWAYTVKGVPAGKAEIISCRGNFHGRTIAIIGMSSEPQYRNGFEPFPAGFVQIPYGDALALAAAITPNTAAFLVEPIQGEGGIVVPPPGYLATCARLCREHNVLLLCDEVQTGLGRTGYLLACQHDKVQPDGLMLGKALGGGLLPISAFLARDELMNVFTPGDHGSTFGGNPLACAVALETLNLIVEEGLIEHTRELGDYFLQKLAGLAEISASGAMTHSGLVRDVRGRGLFVGVELNPNVMDARAACEILLRHGILTKDTHSTVLRFAPPLTITREQIDVALGLIDAAFNDIDQHRPHDLHAGG